VILTADDHQERRRACAPATRGQAAVHGLHCEPGG